MTSTAMRKYFFKELLKGLKVVWPILSGLIGIMIVTGVVVCELEGWPVGDGVYFAFISGLTIGYGDLAPQHALSRVLAVMIGFIGILLMGLVTAVGVRALDTAWQKHERESGSQAH